MKNLKPQCWRYWLAMNASAFDAAVHACAAYFGVAGAHAALDSVPALSAQQWLAVFAISFARGVLNYLEAHPLSAWSAAAPDSQNAPTQPANADHQSAIANRQSAIQDSYAG
jgi:hypothetical protein